MHDGRFATLERVVDFYDDGIRTSPTLDPVLRGPNGQAIRLGLTAAEKTALVAFLRTLTDPAFATDPRLADPFTGTTASAETPGASGLALAAAGPNPFRGQTAVRMTLPAAAEVAVVVYDAAGRRVAMLAEGRRGAGETTLVWNADGLPAGRYTVRATAAGQTATRALTLIR